MAKKHRRSIIFSILSILLFFFTATTFAAATYEYDDLNRLKKYVSAGKQTDYTYDENGNRESKVVTQLLVTVQNVDVDPVADTVSFDVCAPADLIVDYVLVDFRDRTDKYKSAADSAVGGCVTVPVHIFANGGDRNYDVKVTARVKTPGVNPVYDYHYVTVNADVR